MGAANTKEQKIEAYEDIRKQIRLKLPRDVDLDTTHAIWSGIDTQRRIVFNDLETYVLTYTFDLTASYYQINNTRQYTMKCCVNWPDNYPMTYARAKSNADDPQNCLINVSIAMDDPKLIEADLLKNMPQVYAEPSLEDIVDKERYNWYIDTYRAEKKATKGLVQEALCVMINFLIDEKLVEPTDDSEIFLIAATYIKNYTVDADQKKSIPEGLLNEEDNIALANLQKMQRQIELYFRQKGFTKNARIVETYRYTNDQASIKNAQTFFNRQVIIYFNSLSLQRYYETLGFKIGKDNNDYKSVEMNTTIANFIKLCKSRNLGL